MDFQLQPSFDLTLEGYCSAVISYARTADPKILNWITVVHQLHSSGELVWEPAQTESERQSRLKAIRNMVIAVSFLSEQRFMLLSNLLSDSSREANHH